MDEQSAVTWAESVWEALLDRAESHGADPDEVWASEAFWASLDDQVDADPTTEAFADAVEDAAITSTRATEAELVSEESRVVEARGTDADGGRVFNVRILAYGDSRNGRRYTESVMRSAAGLYNGAKAYDRHRSAEELRSSTLSGLVGQYRNVEARSDGLYGDLHLLPSATHVAEALDASIAAQAQGLPPLVGISHDVMASFRPVVANGRRLQEATVITAVQSADVVATPSAGGMAVRAVAGGELEEEDPDDLPDGDVENNEESEVPTTQAVLEALSAATPEELAAVGLTRASESTSPVRAVESIEYDKTSVAGRQVLAAKAQTAGVDVAVLAASTPDRFTESTLDQWLGNYKGELARTERSTLVPTAVTQVTTDEHQRKVEALDGFFSRDYRKGYRSFRQAWADFTGYRGNALDLSEVNRRIVRESIGFDSGERATESMTSSTWSYVLGDSITRRLVAAYNMPSLTSWRSIVSSIVPVADFRTQRIDRVGGYGTLPGVTQGSPYQPLTSPSNEEATYAITKRGGTEDITLEMIANDDVRAISQIPVKLGLAAAQTLYRFVWDTYDPNGSNAALTYDSVALYHASHFNTAATTLSQSNLSAARLAMRAQAAYGDTKAILSLVPKILVVCNDIEEIAYQLCTSAVAIPSTPAGPTDTPNIHQGMSYIVVDYWTTTTGWVVFADPNLCPTFELGFYQGKEEPELFTQMDPNYGSVFNSDTITYKIRHIYSGAVLDHRGTYRGNS